MKKVLSILLSFVLTFLFCTSATASTEDGINNSSQYYDIETIMKEVSDQISEQMDENVVEPTRYYYLWIDEDKTCTGADFGYSYSRISYGNPARSHNWGTSYGGWADALVNCSTAPGVRTDGQAWAWVGNRISVGSNNSKTQEICDISFFGDVYGRITNSLVTSGGQVAVWGEVYDCTDQTLVAQFTDWNGNQPGTYSRYFDPSGTCTLKKNHIYDFRMVVWVRAFDSIGADPVGSSSDFYSNGYGSDGLDYDSITFEWQ